MVGWVPLLAPAALILLIVYLLLKQSYYKASLPKGGKSIPTISNRRPLIQHMKQLATHNDNILEYFQKQTNTFGNIWQFFLPTAFLTKPKAIVFTADPKVLQFVLSTGFKQGLFAKGKDGAEQYKEFLGKGIFTSNGQRWTNIREFSSSLFHVGGLKQYVDIFDENAKQLFTVLDAYATNETMRAKGIDVQDYFMRYTLDAFSEIGFGVKINSMRDDENLFAKAFDEVQVHSNQRGRVGPLLWKLKEKVIPPKSYYSALEYMNNYVETIIQERKKDNRAKVQTQGDLISRLLMVPDSEFAATDEDLRDFVMNFLIAGRDTTAVLLTWCVYLLSQNPDVEEKLLKEFEDVIGDEHPTFANTKNLSYCKQVLQETLRLFPPVPVDGFEAQQDCTLPGGYFVEKKTLVLYCAYDLHRREELWGADANEFRPERFDSPPTPYTWLPFHGGPRECLGREMAYLEAKVMLVNLLRKYKLSLHPSHKVEMKKGIILTAKHGMRMDVTPRSNNL